VRREIIRARTHTNTHTHTHTPPVCHQQAARDGWAVGVRREISVGREIARLGITERGCIYRGAERVAVTAVTPDIELQR
jgi:hypothetical protein